MSHRKQSSDNSGCRSELSKEGLTVDMVSPWEAEYHDGGLVRWPNYDSIKRSELKFFHLMDTVGERVCTRTLKTGDVLLYRKRTTKVLEHPTLTQEEVDLRLGELSQWDLKHAVAVEDFGLVGVEGITFGELRKRVYIVGYIDTKLEEVHLSTFSEHGEEMDKWVGSVEEMNIELRLCELMQLQSLSESLYARCVKVAEVSDVNEVAVRDVNEVAIEAVKVRDIHKVEIKG